MHDSDVVIVGAGLTGLRAALELVQAGLRVLVLEKDDQVGGRLRTTMEAGCVLDHGFQVILPGYPELSTLPALDTLECRAFWSGARIRLDSKVYEVLDPLRHPRALLSTLASPIVSLRDLIKLAMFVQGASLRRMTPASDSTAAALDSLGLTELFKGAFLRPFLRGVLLDPSLSADSGLARFYLKVFSRGGAIIPARGIQALPELLATTLGRQHILLSTAASQVLQGRVVLQNGDEIRAKWVVCAADALSSAALGAPEQTMPHSGTTTVYFLADKPPYEEPLLTLNGDGSGPINNLAVLTNVQPGYAPDGKALISASVLGESALHPDDQLIPAVRKQLHEWYGSQIAAWEFIKSFRIPHALPARPRFSNGWLEREGVFYAGDYLSYGSQNGALLAGRSVAQEIVGRS